MADGNQALRLAESEQSGELACDACGKAAPLVRVVAYGIETMACAECRGEPPPLMDQIVAICRAGHERALRKIAEPQESYTAWRERHEERWWAERSNQGRE